LAGGWIGDLRLKPAISLRALAKPRITRDRSKLPGARDVDCLRRKEEADISWQVLPQPPAIKGCKGLTALARRRLLPKQ
jgi:hypothetical protein